MTEYEYGGLVSYWTDESNWIVPVRNAEGIRSRFMPGRILISPSVDYPYLLWEIRGVPGVMKSRIVCETNDGEYLFTLDTR